MWARGVCAPMLSCQPVVATTDVLCCPHPLGYCDFALQLGQIWLAAVVRLRQDNLETETGEKCCNFHYDSSYVQPLGHAFPISL